MSRDLPPDMPRRPDTFFSILIGRDDHLDQYEADNIAKLVREYGPWVCMFC